MFSRGGDSKSAVLDSFWLVIYLNKFHGLPEFVLACDEAVELLDMEEFLF